MYNDSSLLLVRMFIQSLISTRECPGLTKKSFKSKESLSIGFFTSSSDDSKSCSSLTGVWIIWLFGKFFYNLLRLLIVELRLLVENFSLLDLRRYCESILFFPKL